jgi:serine/threonine protein phosphatase PrpC
MPAVSSFSEAGGHPHNEDATGVRAHPADEKALLVALADGMGGQAGGGPASRLAVRVALETACQSPLSELAWERVLSAADRAVERDNEAGYTTLGALSVVGNQVASI